MTTSGIRIEGKHSYEDFGLYLAERDIGMPERKMVTGEVPYMSGYYDFSSLCGEPAYGSRTLTYTFDIMEDSAEETEEKKNKIFQWAASAVESKIYDDDDPDYYFIGSYTSMTFAPDEDLPEEGGQITLTFTAQPYRYSRSTDEGVI